MTIKVIDENGVEGTTYPRRAKQLVLKNKAVWMGDSTIVLKKEKKMEHVEAIFLEEIEPIEENRIDLKNLETKKSEAREIEIQNITTTSKEEVDNPSDELLMYIAKNNIKYRRNLIMNCILLLPGLFIMLLLSNQSRDMFFVGMYVSWVGYTLYRVIKQVIPHIQNLLGGMGIQKTDPIQAEFEKLKKQGIRN